MHNSHPQRTPFKSSALNDWYHRGSYKELCGHTVFTLDEGDKNNPTVILIHGFPTSSFDFSGIWPTLLKHYRLVSLDMLGFGFSDKPNKRNYTIHLQADLFDALALELQLTEFHVLAHDYGVSVAQELLARQVDATAKAKWLSCGLLNGGLFPETHQALLIQKLMLSRLGKWINKLTDFKQFSASFSTVFGADSKPTQTELTEFWEVINFNDGRHVFHNLITYMHDRLEHRSRWVNCLQHSPIPIALINGSLDPVSGRHLVARYKQLNCRLDYLKELPTIGHYPQVEAADKVAKAYLNFLSTLPERTLSE